MAQSSTPEVLPDEPPPAVDPAEVVLHRLTAAQYRNSIADLFGDQIIIPGPVEPDVSFGGLIALGASRATISPWGVEQYENAAYDLAEQVMADPLRVVSCAPAGTIDLACARTFAAEMGRRVWRRPLEEEEIVALVKTATTGAGVLGDFYDGLELALAAMLQSPSFLFRVELGEPDPNQTGARRYNAYEMASRLSFLLWNTTPDETLLAAAESGALLEDEGLKKAVDRLLASPRAKDGVRAFFSDLFELHRLDELAKDPNLFVHFSSDLGEVAREETLRVLEYLIFDLDADYRELFTLERTFVDRRLASIYNVRASTREGFGPVSLPPEGERRGLLGHVSFLALNAHPVSTSATLRGRFVRQVLLCDEVPPPPVDVNTALPEPSGTTRTLRERVKEHITNPGCEGCHKMMDPIGLGFERFDGIGRLRQLDHGAPIDPSAELDGVIYPNSWELAQGLHDHPKIGACLVRNLYRYATGNVEAPGEAEQLAWLTRKLERSDYRVKSVLAAVAQSPGFRLAKEAAR